MAVSFVALLAAMSGTAAALPGSNGVNSGDIKNGSVKSADIKNNSVAGKDIKSGTVKGSDIDESSLGKVPSAASADKAGVATSAGVAGNANALGGKPASAFQEESALLFATVAPGDSAAAIVRGRGATKVEEIATGFYAVTFARDVSGCSWLATHGQPDDDGVGSLFATVRGTGPTNEVGVVIWDDAGNQADSNGFHLQVICP